MKKIAGLVLSLFGCAHVWAATLYVDLNNTAPTAPYNTWKSAATNIQDAVDAAVDGDEIVITNGHYLLSEEISVTNAISLQSVNGSNVTIIDGGGSVSCFNLGESDCLIEGLTITNGNGYKGGGIYCLSALPVVINCNVVGNRAFRYGGGIFNGTVNNCTIRDNSAIQGGGMFGGMANNCTIVGNSAFDRGGGMSFTTANNCTIVGNSAKRDGGGMSGGTANNCIIWYNHASSRMDLSSVEVNYSYSPDLSHGVNGNSTNSPMLVSLSHISTNSPCVGAGSADYAVGTDIDGEAWQTSPSIGCDEYTGSVTGALQVAVECQTSEIVQRTLVFSAYITGAPSQLIWDFDDETIVTNAPFVEHAWSVPGNYDVVLTVYNDTWPAGVSTTQVVEILSFESAAIYVSPSGDDANDGLSWATAKATIQSGVDAQLFSGGWVVVSNGTYTLTEEVLVDKTVVVRSFNGPENTIVDGQGSVRCFNLGDSACLIEGLTITNGYSYMGGGVYCSRTVNVLTNCTIVGNSASDDGGGMYCGTANNCTISGNSTMGSGGGMYLGKANNCVISGNSAFSSGGGMYGGTANNCTISRNSAFYQGGGMYGGTANNCIVWYNKASDGADLYYVGDALYRYSCSPDLMQGENGNSTNAPMLVSLSHIAANSPCIGAGSADYVVGADIDGEAWQNSPSMGCDEHTGLATGALYLSMDCPAKGIASHPLELFSQVEGVVSQLVWNIGNETMVTNAPFVEYVWRDLGNFDVVLTAYNDTWPLGVSVTQTIEIVSTEETAIYVALAGDDSNDGLSWATAKSTIQAGVDAQPLPGGWVVVSNGTYALTQEIVVDNAIIIRGVADPESIIVDGQSAVRCFNLGSSGCTIEGMTIENGYSFGDGGGVYCYDSTPLITNCIVRGSVAQNSGAGGGVFRGTVNNCTIKLNAASYGGGIFNSIVNNCTITRNAARYGAGIYGGIANNCLISDNSATYAGGGMYQGTANNCEITGNSATDWGGGMSVCTANNCLIVYNSSLGSCGGMSDCTANNCIISRNTAANWGGGMGRMDTSTANNCIVWHNKAPIGADLRFIEAYFTCSPDVTHGVDGNSTNAPCFVDYAGGDFHLMSSSPCIDAGTNEMVFGSVDLDGRPRIVDGVVDMGAYEYQPLPSADLNDDGDAFNNLEEYVAGTDSANAASFFTITNVTVASGFVVEWSPCVADRYYKVLWADSLTNKYSVLQDNIEYPQDSYTDAVHQAESTGFYRVEVRLK